MDPPTSLYMARGDPTGCLFYVFHIRPGRVSTRHGCQYEWDGTVVGEHCCTHYTSMTMKSSSLAILHSSALFSMVQPTPNSFLEAIASFGNPSLWANLMVDNDGDWICHGLLMGMLITAHDGSYMPEGTVDLCSEDVVMYCKTSKKWLRLSLVECLHDASNYHGELLGAVLAVLILQAATSYTPMPPPQTTLYCDNWGVNSHGNLLLVALSKKQQQADLIQLVKHLLAMNNCRSSWVWEGHAVKRKGRENCSLCELLNNQANGLASEALLSAMGGPIMVGDFPFEPVRLKLSGERVCGSPCQALEWDWGYGVAQSLYLEKGIILAEDFHLVWWEGLGVAMSRYPKLYRVWLTRHVADCCGKNVQFYYRSAGGHSPKCEFCGTEDKYSSHMCRCKDPGPRKCTPFRYRS
jgi:hypothetical protein